jgi:putative two-component system response regulator
MEIIHRLGHAAEYKDNETGNHIIRMSLYTRILASRTGMSETDREMVTRAAPMHDIGKIGIPDRILLKPGPLTPEEWAIMRSHAEIGADLLAGSASPMIQLAQSIALSHHERWDGTGYPRGLKGEEIPLAGRIVAIADVFDALTSERPYKRAWPVEDAVAEMRRGAGHHFDPELVELFFGDMLEVLDIRDQYRED